jgi:hypothetical protein
MILIYYTNKNKHVGQRLQHVINIAIPKEPTQVTRSLQSLSRHLHIEAASLKAVVLLTASGKELFEILSIRDLLNDIKIILILPDSKRETVLEGHKLYPRFTTYLDSNFDDVAAVLTKLVMYLNINHYTNRREISKWQI